LKSSLKIALIYLACGLLWIFLSDRFLYSILNYSGEELTRIQTFKGFFYIGVTAVLLFYIVNSFYKKLGNKLKKLEETNTALEESEKRYSDLFRYSPLPLWVYDCATLRFMAVNEAAIAQYGYSKEEFLSKTIIDIRPREEVPKLMGVIEGGKHEGQFALRGVFKHIKKSGEVVTVEIRSNDMIYKGVKAKVVLVNDITERMNYTAAIEKQNAKLQEIAHMQSHVVRAPLATLMGFVHLLEEGSVANDEKKEIHKNILQSASDLDNIIKDISEKASEVI
jgi:PAS domain S-box-containing protein